MHWRSLITGGFAGGVALTLIALLISSGVQLIAPYDIFALGGIRAADDPVMLFFFAYPLVIAFSAALVFDLVRPALSGSDVHRGLVFGGILFLLFTIPNQFVIFSSMTYPAGFYLSNIATGIIGFPLLGIILSTISARWG